MPVELLPRASTNAAAANGGGIYNEGGELSLHNAIIAENTAENFGVDLRSEAAATTTGGNLLGNPAGSGLVPGPTVATTF